MRRLADLHACDEQNCYELVRTFNVLLSRPTNLQLVSGEATYTGQGTGRKVSVLSTVHFANSHFDCAADGSCRRDHGRELWPDARHRQCELSCPCRLAGIADWLCATQQLTNEAHRNIAEYRRRLAEYEARCSPCLRND